MIDQWIIKNWENLDWQSGLSYNNRLGLINILNEYVIINDKVMSVSSSMNILSKSFVSVSKYNDTRKLKLPSIIENESILQNVINDNENDELEDE